MFSPLVSPSLVMKREILAVAAAEAVRFGTTVKDVIEAYFGGTVRPGLRACLESAERAAGIPPHDLMALVGEFQDPEEIEPADLVILVQAYSDRLPTGAQAREIVEAAQRLARRARAHEKRVRAAQAAYDASVVPGQPDGPLLDASRATRRPVRARAVQRYRGLRS